MKRTTFASASVAAVIVFSPSSAVASPLTPTQELEAAQLEFLGPDDGFRDDFVAGRGYVVRQSSSPLLDTQNSINDNRDGHDRSRIRSRISTVENEYSDPNNPIDSRRTQQNAASPQNTKFLSSNPSSTIQDIENHLFSPEVQESIQSLFQSRVIYEGSIHTFPSFRYTFDSFWKNWKRMLTTGISTGKNNNNNEKILLFGGDNNYHNATIQFTKLIPQTPIQIAGFEYGLANMAAFLSQVMVDGIYDDTCDELNSQPSPTSANDEVATLSNACGQYGLSYQDMTCPNDEKEMECPVSDRMTITSTQSSGDTPMRCGPQGTFPALEKLQLENQNGRTDSEGCCWWGRGPLATRGVCNIGKANYYLGKRAVEEGRAEGTEEGIFGDIDFCAAPEAICNAKNEDLLWSVAMLEWAERVQRYRGEDVLGNVDGGDGDDDGGNDGDGGENGFIQTRKKKEDKRPFNYDERLIEFVESGMNVNDYYPNKRKDDSFIVGVSSIVNRGCHKESECGAVHNLSLRKTAFAKVLSALRIPIPRELQLVETALDFLKSKKEGFETNLLQYQELSGSFSPSTRYQFDDFVDALTRVSLPYEFIPPESKANYYFTSPDHSPFYMGDPYMKDGHKYGLGNIALFFANGLDLAIEHNSCDEHNVHPLAFKLPLSNSCGSRGVSFQNMVCDSSNDNNLPDMSCEVDYNMELEAVTSEAAPPFQCAPVSKIPFTGFWDLENNVVVTDEAYANDNGRVNVEGCCWWGRGFLHTKGICSYGRLNYYLGARAAKEGRNSLYPNIDFCLNPEAICSSDNSTELQWMTGMFEWLDRVQSYDKGGFNYIDELHKFADAGYQDDTFIKSVLSIVQVGCHNPPCETAGCVAFPCDGANPVDDNEGVTKAFRTLLELNLWKEFDMTKGGTHEPTPSPTECTNCTETTYAPTLSPMFPTMSPTYLPTEPPTFRPSPPPTRAIVNDYAIADEVEKFLDENKAKIESTIFVSDSANGKVPSKLYSYDGFLYSLKEASRKGIGENYFYFGQGKEGGRDYGLVNIALFLSHAMTRGLKWDTCEEVNEHAIDDKLPMSNACGQFGKRNGDEVCLMSDVPMACPVDPNMSVTQISVGNSGSPPFFCAPKSSNPFTGYYNLVSDQSMSDTPFPNEAGREDVEGCCWWGRGILLTPGVCDIGKFNYLYGLPAFKESRNTARYNIDFCVNPEAFCSNFSVEGTGSNQFSAVIDTTDIRYAYGMQYWIDHVQKFSWGFWDYMDRLKRFVDDGMTDDSFVDEFSDIVLESRHDAPLRKANFNRILSEVFSLKTKNEPTPIEPAGQNTNPPTRLKLEGPSEEEDDHFESSISESDKPLGTSIPDQPMLPITSNPPAPPSVQPEPPSSLPFANTRVEGISPAPATNVLFGIATITSSLIVCLITV